MSMIRHQGLVNITKLGELKVAIIGCGAIGSYTASALTKMGVKQLILYDNDVVALHNVSNQFFTIDSIGKPKVIATKEECLRHSPQDGVIIIPHNELYTGQPLDADIIIATTDNIEGRNLVLQQAKKNLITKLFIDGRMNAEAIRAFAFNPKNFDVAEKYYKDYIEDVKDVEAPCTEKTIIYTVQFAASIITAYVKKYVKGEEIPYEFGFMFPNMYTVKGK